MIDEFNAIPTVKSGMGSSQSMFSRCNDNVIESIFSFLNIKSQQQLKNTCRAMRNIIQQSDMCARLSLLPFVEQTKRVDFTDVMQLLPMYGIKCYNQMTLYCASSVFQTYCRVISYHWHLIWTHRSRCDKHQNPIQHGLSYLHPHKNMKVFVGRDMNEDTMKLFTLNPNQKYIHDNRKNDPSILIWDKKTFLFLLNEKWHLNKWKDIVFRSDKQHLLIGGSVCSALIKFIDKDWKRTKENQLQDLDFAMLHCSTGDARDRVNKMKSLFDSRGFPACVCDGGSKSIFNLVVNFTENESNTIQMDIKNEIERSGKDIIENEPFLTLFEFIVIGKHCDNWSFLHQIDLDCSQVGFDGQDVICTYAFLQSVTTQTIINYSLVNDYWAMQRTNAIQRIEKYYHRGFTLLAPKPFNFSHLDQSLGLSIPMNDTLSQLIEKRMNDIQIMRDNYKRGYWKRTERGIAGKPDVDHSDWDVSIGSYGTRDYKMYEYNEQATEDNTFLSKTISGMPNNDSMHMMESFLKLHTYLISTAKQEVEPIEATGFSDTMALFPALIDDHVDANSFNKITPFRITRKVNYQEQMAASLNQRDNIQMNALIIAKKKMFISEHVNQTATEVDHDTNSDERLTMLESSSLYKVANAFAYRAPYYHRMERKVSEYLHNLNDVEISNKLQE
eukprot:969722_1